MRTANRNIDFLRKTVEQVNNNPETTDKAVRGMGTPKEIDAYFDVFTVAFGKHLIRLMNEAPRTLEHPVEEILADYRLELSTVKNELQVDFVEKGGELMTKEIFSQYTPPFYYSAHGVLDSKKRIVSPAVLQKALTQMWEREKEAE